MEIAIIDKKEDSNPRLYTVLCKYEDGESWSDREKEVKQFIFNLWEVDRIINNVITCRIVCKKNVTNFIKNENTFYLERHILGEKEIINGLFKEHFYDKN